MEHTPNYQLPRWALSDPIQMNDFNAAFAAIDTALKANADSDAALTAALGAGGKLCRIKYGSYTGNGEGGKTAPNTLSCDFYPVLMIITTIDAYSTISRAIAVRGITQFDSGVGNRQNTITWNDRGASWYPSMENDTYYNACDVQLNTAGTVYRYLLLGFDQ